jgi:hypothetical protein
MTIHLARYWIIRKQRPVDLSGPRPTIVWVLKCLSEVKYGHSIVFVEELPALATEGTLGGQEAARP